MCDLEGIKYECFEFRTVSKICIFHMEIGSLFRWDFDMRKEGIIFYE